MRPRRPIPGSMLLNANVTLQIWFIHLNLEQWQKTTCSLFLRRQNNLLLSELPFELFFSLLNFFISPEVPSFLPWQRQLVFLCVCVCVYSTRLKSPNIIIKLCTSLTLLLVFQSISVATNLPEKKTKPGWLVKFTIDSLHLLGETLMVRISGTKYAEEWLWYFGSVFVTGSEYLSSSW